MQFIIEHMEPILKDTDLLDFYKSEFYGKRAIEKYRDWFPVLPSPSLAGIIADLIADGHLQGNPKWRIDYTSKRKEELLRFENEIFKLFSKKGKIRPCNGNKLGTSFNYGINCKPLARTLHLLGVPSGRKIKKGFLIPRWILDDKERFRRFVRRLFDCEGCVSVESGGSFISIEMWKAEELMEYGIHFFEDVKKHLDRYFDIQTTRVYLNNMVVVRNDGLKVRGIRLRIKRLKSLVKFYKEIGFDDQTKQNKLKEALLIRGCIPARGW
jgi:intein/homing endonuclease